MKTIPWYKSRTILMFLATLIVSVLSDAEVLAIIPDSCWKYVAAITSTIGILLRVNTDRVIERKSK